MVVKGVASSRTRQKPSRWLFPAFVLALVVVVLAVSTWMHFAPSPQKTIVGKWSNAQGGVIEFYADGTGHVPAILDLPAYDFTYSFLDDTHLKVSLDGQDLSVGIAFKGDQMIWRNSYNSTEYTYTREK